MFEILPLGTPSLRSVGGEARWAQPFPTSSPRSAGFDDDIRGRNVLRVAAVAPPGSRCPRLLFEMMQLSTMTFSENRRCPRCRSWSAAEVEVSVQPEMMIFLHGPYSMLPAEHFRQMQSSAQVTWQPMSANIGGMIQVDAVRIGCSRAD